MTNCHGKMIGKTILLNFLQIKEMLFTRKDKIYRILRLTGSQDNILGVSFSEDNEDTKIEVIQWPIQ